MIIISLLFIIVPKDESKPEKSSIFKVIFKRDSSFDGHSIHFIRCGITINDVRIQGVSGIIGLVIIDESPLAELLRDAENPAHTEWQKNSREVKKKYKHGADCIEFVRRSIPEIVKKCDEGSSEIDMNLLRHFFWIEQDEGKPTPERGKTKIKKGTSSEPVIPTQPRKPSPFIIIKTSGGFRVKINPDFDDELPRQVIIKAAYDVRKGEPFNKYDALDFKLEELEVELKNAKVNIIEDNRLTAEIENRDFEISINGFDPNRDLVVRVIKGRVDQ